MNKTEKIICLVLGGLLAWYLFVQMPKEQKARAAQAAKVQLEAARAAKAAAEAGDQDRAARDLTSSDATSAPGDTNRTARDLTSSDTTSASAAAPSPSEPERKVVLENAQLKLELSSWGAVVTKATLKEYAKDRGPVSEKNPAVTLDFAASPMGALEGIAGLAANASYDIKSQSSNEVVFANGVLERKITLGTDYRVTFDEKFLNGQSLTPNPRPTTLSLGVMRMGDSKNDLLSVDSWALDSGKGKPGVLHHCEGDSPLKSFLVGGLSGGCSGSSKATGMPEKQNVSVPGGQVWIAVKNRFFVTALARSTAACGGFETTVARDLRSSNYRPASVAVKAQFAAGAGARGDRNVAPTNRTTVFYVGPKKQALLWDLGMRDVMEFGMWRWICYPLVWVLNLFNAWIPNFGVAIILLTILVRILFWPLTRKSTEGMKKMQEVQPLMKEIQAKYKDNPQRLQQETWALYKEKKVNPMSSCLPMLIQIPVFIALFNVLRSAVELRYAPFLWIGDLSEPEALFASWFPFGGLNLLPILMAVSTGLQSWFTPSAGDAKQQRMMMIMMPVMMLVMFYSFPSALSLYWFLSNLFSIVQMWLIRRQSNAAAKTEVLTPEVIDPPTTRQMRRHS